MANETVTQIKHINPNGEEIQIVQDNQGPICDSWYNLCGQLMNDLCQLTGLPCWQVREIIAARHPENNFISK